MNNIYGLISSVLISTLKWDFPPFSRTTDLNEKTNEKTNVEDTLTHGLDTNKGDIPTNKLDIKESNPATIESCTTTNELDIREKTNTAANESGTTTNESLTITNESSITTKELGIEPRSESEAETETKSEKETESKSEKETESETESEKEKETESKSETEKELETKSETEKELESKSEKEKESKTESEIESDTQLKTPNKITGIYNQLNNFDIMLFNGRNYWFSYLVEYVTWSRFSHIGIVLKSPTWLHPSLTDNYLLESGLEDIPDAISHKLKFGVRITPLDYLLKNYTGEMYYRNLESIAYKENPEYYHETLKRIYDMIQNKPYDDSVADLIIIPLHLKLGDCQRTNAFFCSALVSFIYVQLGILPSDLQWDLIEPRDYGVHRTIETEMEQQRMASFGPLVHITMD